MKENIFELTRIISLAGNAHAEQVDKVGDPYLKHLHSVANIAAIINPFDLDGNDLLKAGYLHDIIEDTEYDAEALKAESVPDNIIAAVELLTKEKGEDYGSYISRIINSQNKLAITVKLADLYDHLTNGNKIPAKSVKRYADALLDLNIAATNLIKYS